MKKSNFEGKRTSAAVKSEEKHSKKPRNRRDRGSKQSRNGSDLEGSKGYVPHKFNDVSWYAKNEAMLRDSASYSYNNPLGGPLPWRDLIVGNEKLSYGVVQGQSGYRGVPGLMSLRILPTIGVSTDSGSPANVAAQNVYSYVRYMNSGAKNYDQADLMLYLLAMDSIYACWNWGKRMYGYMRTFSQLNQYMPKAYLVADCAEGGVDFNAWMTNLANLRYFLNESAARISAFCVPAVMPYFIRHSWMFSNIYKDSDTEKAQQYMFVPDAFYKYSETTSQFGGQLIPQRTGSTTTTAPIMYTFANYTAYLNKLIDAIAYSEDIGVMSGDILKAYGQEKLFKLAPVDPDYTVLPVYNEEVLNQIHNSSIVPVKATFDDSYNVTQDPDSGFLKWNPTIQPYAWSRKRAILNMPWENVTPANTMVGSRLTTMVTEVAGNTFKLDSCGSEIVTRIDMYTRTAHGQLVPNSFDTFYITIDAVTDLTAYYSPIRRIAELTNFDWHPVFVLLNTEGTLANMKTNVCGLLGDMSNYTTIDKEGLQKLHFTAIMSEFNIPQIGTF